MAIYINDKITRRGIAKGLVNIQEDFNKSILEVEKQTIKALISQDKVKQYEYLTKAKLRHYGLLGNRNKKLFYSL